MHFYCSSVFNLSGSKIIFYKNSYGVSSHSSYILLFPEKIQLHFIAISPMEGHACQGLQLAIHAKMQGIIMSDSVILSKMNLIVQTF